MKGQSQSMYSTVDKVCGRKFKKETRVYIGKDDYSVFNDGMFAQVRMTDGGEYVVTRLKARFGGKKCEEMKADDWGDVREIKVTNNIGTFVREGKEIGLEGCMNAVEFYGYYK